MQVLPHPTTVAAAERLRRTIARRRDALVWRQRRGYSRARQRLIDQLARDYDAVLAIALDAGAELGLRRAS